MAANARRYRLAVFTKNRKNPAYVGARLGADRVAARHGCVVTHYVPDKPDDTTSSTRCSRLRTPSAQTPC